MRPQTTVPCAQADIDNGGLLRSGDGRRREGLNQSATRVNDVPGNHRCGIATNSLYNATLLAGLVSC